MGEVGDDILVIIYEIIMNHDIISAFDRQDSQSMTSAHQ